MAYIFVADSRDLSSLKLLWWAPKDASFLQQSAYRPFKVIDSLKVHVKLERSSFSESRDNRGVPNLQFWSRDPDHASIGDKLRIIFIVLNSLIYM